MEMKRWIGLVVLALTFSVGTASAQDHMKGGLGFHNVEAPLGVRWWLSSGKFAIDAGLGFGENHDPATDENLSHWALDIGVPISLKRWDRVDFMFRPGVLYTSQEEVTGVAPITTDNTTVLAVNAELEAEVFLADNVSFSAAQGFGIFSTEFAGGGSESNWGTTGANFTNIGFHVYLFGGEGTGRK
jgi:hypothetical protein